MPVVIHELRRFRTCLGIGDKVRTTERLQPEASNATLRKHNMNQKKRWIGAATVFIDARLAAASQVAPVRWRHTLQAIACPVTTPNQSLFFRCVRGISSRRIGTVADDRVQRGPRAAKAGFELHSGYILCK
jgi:hypothetical protein